MAYKLTPLGEGRALRVDKASDPESAIVAYMYEEKDALELEEIAGETHMSDEAAGRVVTRLISAGYVKEL